MAQNVRDLRTRGIDVIGLGVGESDFGTPGHIRQAGIDAIRAGKTGYTAVDGIPELKTAICEKFKRENGLEYTPGQINVSPGGKAVLYNALQVTLNPGNEVIIPAPSWVSYPDIVRLVGGNPVIVPTLQDDGFRLQPETLEAHITPQTRWLILNSPSNPTGAAYSAADLAALAEVLRRHEHVWVLSDDIYEHLLYDGFKFATMAEAAPDLYARTLTMNGVSKAYAMTGWRIGYAGGPKPLIRAMAKVMDRTTSNPASISQWAALEALSGPQEFLNTRRDVFRKRRDLVVKRLNDISGLSCFTPMGAFYVFPDCRALLGTNTDVDFAQALLEKARVGVVPGSAFHAPGYIRISYSLSTAELETACARIAGFCTGL